MIRRMTFGMLLRGIGQRKHPTYISNICICVMLIRPKLWKCGLFVAKSEPGPDPKLKTLVSSVRRVSAGDRPELLRVRGNDWCIIIPI